MNTRNLMVVAVLMLLSTSSGCTGMRNFLFGRGAQCGLCNRPGSPLNLLPQRQAEVPYGVVPYGPPAAVAPSADCSCNGYNPGLSYGSVGGSVYSGMDDSLGSYGTAYGNPDCNCGGRTGYGSGYADPYLGGEVVGSAVMPRAGEYIPGEGTVVPGTVIPGGTNVTPGFPTAPSLPDNFDTRSNRVMITEPIAPGVQYLP